MFYSRPALARPKCVLRRPKQTRGKMEITLPPDGVRRQTGYVGTSPDRALLDTGTAERHFRVLDPRRASPGRVLGDFWKSEFEIFKNICLRIIFVKWSLINPQHPLGPTGTGGAIAGGT